MGATRSRVVSGTHLAELAPGYLARTGHQPGVKADTTRSSERDDPMEKSKPGEVSSGTTLAACVRRSGKA
jgi:hypothetical protein